MYNFYVFFFIFLSQQMDTKRFAVVEFAEDSAVEIIPMSWLEETKEVLFCFLIHLHNYITKSVQEWQIIFVRGCFLTGHLQTRGNW